MKGLKPNYILRRRKMKTKFNNKAKTRKSKREQEIKNIRRRVDQISKAA